MTDTDLITPTLGETPFVLIEQTPDDTEATGFHINVRAGGGVNDSNHLVTLLLLVVEQITGVSASLFVQEIDIARKAARSGAVLVPLDDDDDEDEDDDTP